MMGAPEAYREGDRFRIVSAAFKRVIGREGTLSEVWFDRPEPEVTLKLDDGMRIVFLRSQLERIPLAPADPHVGVEGHDHSEFVDGCRAPLLR